MKEAARSREASAPLIVRKGIGRAFDMSTIQVGDAEPKERADSESQPGS
jgi:hypothetical protein